MTLVLAWLLALPRQVVRLVRTLLLRLAQVGGRRPGSRDPVIAELRRRYPDAPEVWLEVVARNISSTPGRADDPMVAAQDLESETVAEALVENEELRAVPPGPISPGAARHGPVTPAAAQGIEAPPVRARSVPRPRPPWREFDAAVPTREFPRNEPLRAEAPVWQPARQSPATTRRPLFSVSEELEDTLAFQGRPKTASADILEADPEPAPSVPDSDPWPILPPRREVHERRIMATSLPPPESSGWQDVADHDRWPALLPEASLPRNAPGSPLGERIARLRTIQERL